MSFLPSSIAAKIHSFADATFPNSSFLFDLPYLVFANTLLHRNTSVSLLTNDLGNIERLGENGRVHFNQAIPHKFSFRVNLTQTYLFHEWQ